MATVGRSSKLVALWKRGWNEIPEVMGASGMALLGIVIGSYGLYNHHKTDGDKKRYKMEYTVYRPDDPRISSIRRPERD